MWVDGVAKSQTFGEIYKSQFLVAYLLLYSVESPLFVIFFVGKFPFESKISGYTKVCDFVPNETVFFTTPLLMH